MPFAVLLHPHPDFGGNQYNNVISALYEALPSAGITPRRFDFASSELSVARAQAIEEIEAADATQEPLYLIGYSFGGAVAATIDHPAVAAWCLIAPALTLFPPSIGSDTRPKHIIAAGRDAWFGPEVLATATADWSATSRESIDAADHFFGGQSAEVARRAVEWLTGQPA